LNKIKQIISSHTQGSPRKNKASLNAYILFYITRIHNSTKPFFKVKNIMKTYMIISFLLLSSVVNSKELSYKEMLDQSMEHLRLLTVSHSKIWGLGKDESWNADLKKGLIWWTFSDKIVEAPIQVIATYSTKNKTLLWGWNHPSVSKKLSKHAELVKKYGLKNNISKLTTVKIKCTENDAWKYTALAVKLADAQGAYRGPAGTTLVFFTFGKISIKKKPEKVLSPEKTVSLFFKLIRDGNRKAFSKIVIGKKSLWDPMFTKVSVKIASIKYKVTDIKITNDKARVYILFLKEKPGRQKEDVDLIRVDGKWFVTGI